MFVAQKNDVISICKSSNSGRTVDLSIIVVTNKRSCLEKYLLASLARQTVSCELVIVDNTPPSAKILNQNVLHLHRSLMHQMQFALA